MKATPTCFLIWRNYRQSCSCRNPPFDSTGGHERPIIVALQNAGFHVARVHANRVRSFARSCGHLAKTDRIDAQVLALFGERMQPAPLRILDKKHMYLSKLYTRRRHLVKTCAAQK